jgi:hypothetical protein
MLCARSQCHRHIVCGCAPPMGWSAFPKGSFYGPDRSQSGDTAQDQGMSKKGNFDIRALVIELGCRLAPACRRFSRHER